MALPEPALHLTPVGGGGALRAAGSGEQVVPASDCRASQVRELQRLLGKKTLEAEILKEAAASRNSSCSAHCGRRDRARPIPALVLCRSCIFCATNYHPLTALGMNDDKIFGGACRLGSHRTLKPVILRVSSTENGASLPTGMARQ
jgi:hypothetical protein